MKRSNRQILRRITAILGLTAVDLAARLAAPLSVVVLSHGFGNAALAFAASVSVLAVLRGMVSGRILERTVIALWRDVVAGQARHSVVALGARSEDRAVILLLEATYRIAELQASVTPRLAADVLGLALVSVAVAALLPTWWLLLGFVALAAGAVSVATARRLVRAAEQSSFDLVADVGRDLRVLLAAPAELRAHGREASHAANMLAHVAAMAAARRRVSSYSSLLGLLPFGAALVAAMVPLRTFLAHSGGVLNGQYLAQVAALGGSALVFAMGVIRSVEELARAAPERQLLREFLEPDENRRTAGDGAVRDESQRRGSSWDRAIEIDGVSVVYPGAVAATPSRARHIWKAGRGLALIGDNGTGKTTLALAVLGLIAPTNGEIRLDGTPLSRHDMGELRKRVVYVPQRGYIDAGRSIEWHLRLVADSNATDEELGDALRAVELTQALANRAMRTDASPLSVPAGELSGGEKRRLHLARLFLPRRHGRTELFVLDEPEAGLDAVGRAFLRRWLASAATEARVLLIAHDERLAPEGFDILRCDRAPLA